MEKYYRTFKLLIIAISVLAPLKVTEANAQWVEQTITLDPNWNAIYLEVQPEPRQCDTIFADLPIESVWCWNTPLSSAQYFDIPPNPDTLVPGQPQWLVYFPPSRPEHVASNMFTMRGGRAYLVKLGGEQPKVLTVRGRPCLPKIDWQSDMYNLVGLHVSNPGPLFENYFSPSPAHADLTTNPVYTLNNTTGDWQAVTDP